MRMSAQSKLREIYGEPREPVRSNESSDFAISILDRNPTRPEISKCWLALGVEESSASGICASQLTGSRAR
jgi:hypothetical protein